MLETQDMSIVVQHILGMLDAQKKLNSILDQINRLNAISDAKASKF
jgi:hypothetical protein